VPSLVTPYPLGRYLASRDAAIMVEPTVSGLAAGLITVLSPASSAVGARARQVVAQAITWDIVARQWLEGISQALGR